MHVQHAAKRSPASGRAERGREREEKKTEIGERVKKREKSVGR